MKRDELFIDGMDFCKWSDIRNRRSERLRKLKKLDAPNSLVKNELSETIKAGIKYSKLLRKTMQFVWRNIPIDDRSKIYNQAFGKEYKPRVEND